MLFPSSRVQVAKGIYRSFNLHGIVLFDKAFPSSFFPKKPMSALDEKMILFVLHEQILDAQFVLRNASQTSSFPSVFDMLLCSFFLLCGLELPRSTGRF
jgi:hypothetical protein